MSSPQDENEIAQNRPKGAEATPPAIQNFFDRPFLLLALGLLVMVIFYTLWGLYEITSLPNSELP